MMRFGSVGLLAAALLSDLVLTAGSAGAVEFGVSGLVAGETRWFPESPGAVDQVEGLQPSLVLRPELRLRIGRGRHRFKVTPHFRFDGRDSDRTHFDLREAYWQTERGNLGILVGVNTVFWGVAESRHLVDVINQADAVEDIDGEDKLGQPMVRLTWQQDWGRLEGYALIGFREMTFPGADGRLGPPVPATDDAHYPDGRAGVDAAVRYTHYFGDYDLGLHYFHGTNREPSFELVADGGDVASYRVRPTYRRIHQIGMDLQRTRGAWLWKLESLVRRGDGSTFTAAVAGFEYTLYRVGGSDADLGLLGEFLYDGRDETASITFYDRDVFVGARFALNDVWDTTALAGAVIDAHDGSVGARIEIERRLTNRIKLELDARLFVDVSDGNALALLARDSFLNLKIVHGL